MGDIAPTCEALVGWGPNTFCGKQMVKQAGVWTCPNKIKHVDRNDTRRSDNRR